MSRKPLPINLVADESIYAGFWRRLGANILDLIIIGLFNLPGLYIESLGRLNAAYMFPFWTVFAFMYEVYSVKKWGGTPGKVISKIKIIKKDGGTAGWREAVLRWSVAGILCIISELALILPLFEITDTMYFSIDWSDRRSYLNAMAPFWYEPVKNLAAIWVWSEVVVLLFNQRKRAFHDYIAGIVVIKRKFEKVVDHYTKLN